MSTAGRLVLATQKVEDVTVEVCDSQLCWTRKVNLYEFMVCVELSCCVSLGM